MSIMCRVYLASGLGLALMAASMPVSASAQMANDGDIRPAVLGLPEFVETLAEITPELLHLQQEVVEARRIQLEGTRQQYRVGQRALEGVYEAEQAYYKELESLRLMTARSNNNSISEKELLKIRIAVKSEALASLKDLGESVKDRFSVGEVTRVDISEIKAKVLKAEIMLEALKRVASD
jgi:hypothetical protein